MTAKQNTLVSKKPPQHARRTLLVEQLESAAYPFIFKYLGITDGSEALRLHREYRGNIVGLSYLGLTRWLDSPAIKKKQSPQGYSLQSNRVSADGKFTDSTGIRFLEIDGVRVALSLFHRNIGFPELHMAFYVRAEDAPRLGTVFTEIERAPSQLHDLVLNGECSPVPAFAGVSGDDIVLGEEIRKVVSSNTIDLLARADLYRQLGVPLKRGLLLWGSPGCGKTLCAKMLMSQVPRSIYVTCSDLDQFGNWGIADIYAVARRLAPCLVVLEDLDVLGGIDRRNQSGRPLGQLLGELDGLEVNQGVITVATTNDVAVLDEALRNRPGRFDLKLHFPNPDHELRLQLLKLFTKSLALATDVDLNTLSNRMEYGNLSCAHVREVITRGIIYATDELPVGSKAAPMIAQAHLERALTVLADPKRRKIGFEPERG